MRSPCTANGLPFEEKPCFASSAKKRKPSGTVLLHDPSLEAARRFAASANARGDKAVAIEGDRVRFARAVFERAPALVVGISRSADAVLIEDVGREAGYVPVAVPATLADMLAGTQRGHRKTAVRVRWRRDHD